MTIAEYLDVIDRVIEKGPYKASWSSLCRHKTPHWFRRDKLGVFIHWGVYSVPAFGNEWYARNMYDPATPEFRHHKDTYGDQKTFGYKDFIPMFKAESFDPSQWVALFKKAGIRYVMPVVEHHDGFAMYDTEFNSFNASAMGPCRDIIAELKRECDNSSLTFCASTHRAEHYFFMNMGRTFDSDVNDKAYENFYGPAVYMNCWKGSSLGKTTENPHSQGADENWLRDWLVRTCEIIDKFKPSVLYFDWWIHNHSFKPYLKKLAAYYYNRAEEWGKEVTINYKHQAFPPGAATFDVERGALTDISPLYWQTDTAIGKLSWGYRKDNQYKSARQIICDLVDIVSKNGNLLINIGPRSDGTITQQETQVLVSLGQWLQVNGEGIYDTTFWQCFGEGEVNAEAGFFKDSQEKAFTSSDFRFTYKDGCVYAFQMRPSQTPVIRALRKKEFHDFIIKDVELLGCEEKISFSRNEDALEINLQKAPAGDFPLCYKITLE